MNADKLRRAWFVSLCGCAWVLLLGFITISMLYGSFVAHLFYLQRHPEIWRENPFGGPLADGNTITDPLRFILNRAAPVGVLAAIALTVLAQLGHGRLKLAVFGDALVVCAVVSLVAFGLWFFHAYLYGYHLQNEVWWMMRCGVK